MSNDELVEMIARALLAANRPDYSPTQIDDGWRRFQFDARAALACIEAAGMLKKRPPGPG
jgi:hypothetical protein